MKGQFPQYHLLDSDAFAKFLNDMEFSINKEYLEYLDKTGIIRPVMRFRKPPGTVIFDNFLIRDQYLKDGLIEFPREGDFQPWASYQSRGVPKTDVLYHPAQFIAFVTLVPKKIIAPWEIERITNPDDFVNRLKSSLVHKIQSSSQSYNNIWTKRIGLLMLLEEAYAPLLHGSTVWGFFEDNDSNFRDWRDWRLKRFDPKIILNNSGMMIEEIKTFYTSNLAFEGYSIDPLHSWYVFLHYIQNSKISWLKGKVRRALEYYALARMVKSFIRDLTKEEMPEPDELDEATIKERIYEVKKFDYQKKKHRIKVINDFLIEQMPQMAIVVEGDTEELVIKKILKALDVRIEREGIIIYNAKGDNMTKNIEGYVHSAKQNNINVFVIVDRDKAQLITKNLNRKTLKKTMFKIWRDDFEYDNFKLGPVVDFVNTKLSKHHLVELKKNGVRQKMISVSSFMHALELEDKRLNRGHDLFSLVSKKDIANHMIKDRVKQIQIEYQTEKWKPKLPIEKVLSRIFKMIPPRSY